MYESVPDIILRQLGGTRFITMTGVKNLSLNMTLPRNKSKANRLSVTLNNNDTYTLRFYRYTAPRLNHKTYTFSNEKVTEVEHIDQIYCDQLESVFTRVTGLYTHF